jgi:hypothetical protein
MGKLQDVNLAHLPQQLIEFKDDVLALVNFGKFQFQMVSVAPTFAGRNGEVTFFRSGTDGRMYVYMGSSWNVASSFTADAS